MSPLTKGTSCTLASAANRRSLKWDSRSTAHITHPQLALELERSAKRTTDDERGGARVQRGGRCCFVVAHVFYLHLTAGLVHRQQNQTWNINRRKRARWARRRGTGKQQLQTGGISGSFGVTNQKLPLKTQNIVRWVCENWLLWITPVSSKNVVRMRQGQQQQQQQVGWPKVTCRHQKQQHLSQTHKYTLTRTQTRANRTCGVFRAEQQPVSVVAARELMAVKNR